MKFRKQETENQGHNHRHNHDVERILRVMTANGYDTDYMTCAFLWDDYSEDYAAGWMGLPESDEDLFKRVLGQAGKNNYMKGIDI